MQACMSLLFFKVDLFVVFTCDWVIRYLDLLEKLIKQHVETLDPSEPRDMIDMFLIEHNRKSYSFEVSLKFSYNK